MKFALFGNKHQSKKSKYAIALFSLLKRLGDTVIIDKDYYVFLTEELGLSIQPDGIIDSPLFDADMVISLGGDGTFLKAAQRVGSLHIPILGINVGRLGFLANTSPEDMEEIFTLIHASQFEIEERSLLQVCTPGKDLAGYPYGLNEVVVLKHDTSSMITIHVTIGDEKLITYQADGIIVATPTGSTGYSLSVGGPVVSPQSNVFVISPVAPHSLTARPLVLGDAQPITLEIESRSGNFLVAIDGRSESCDEKTKIILQKAPYNIQMVKRVGQTFFQTLRDKMMWGIDYRN